MEDKKFVGSNDNVIKFVFTGEDYVLESVLYKYPEGAAVETIKVLMGYCFGFSKTIQIREFTIFS